MLFYNDPFRNVEAVLNRVGGQSTAGSGMPMDAYRRGEDVWVHVDLPGVTAENLEINVERNVLTLAAERSWHAEDTDRAYLAERAQGRFQRQVHLGEGLDAGGIEADLSDGVLTLRIPVAEQAKPRKISIGTGGVATAIEAESTPA